MKIIVTYRRKRAGISMRVTRTGDISVSAPIGIPKSVVMDFINSHKGWIDKATRRQQESEQRRCEFFERLPLSTAAQRRSALTELNSIIPPLVDKYETAMGVKASGFTYRCSKTRWGSCNPRTRHINFSIYLLLLPDWCIEHVVVHELAHLIVPNHSAAFYAIMDEHFPRWKEARATTRRLSRLE